MFDLTLSFDNGPDPDTTPGVLNTLARRDVRATFFVIGQKLRDPAARACAERAHAEGHWIGNHTWSHETPLGLLPGAEATEREIDQTQAEIGALAHPGRWFRPMGGGGVVGPHLLSSEAAGRLVAGRYSLVLWNAVPRDWADPEGWVETALAQVSQQDWTLLVLHDLPTGAMRHLERFLDAIEERGGRIEQDFPPDCVPLRNGVAVSGIGHLVTLP